MASRGRGAHVRPSVGRHANDDGSDSNTDNDNDDDRDSFTLSAGLKDPRGSLKNGKYNKVPKTSFANNRDQTV